MTPDTAECTLNMTQIKTDIYYQSYLALGSGGGIKITQLRTTALQLLILWYLGPI